GQMRSQFLGKGSIELMRYLEVVPLGVAAVRRVHPEDKDRSRLVRPVWRTSMDGQSGTSGDIAHLRHLLLRTRLVTLVKMACRKHFVFEIDRQVPLRARRNFERTHVCRYIYCR